jgi:Mg2+-importing ATPase
LVTKGALEPVLAACGFAEDDSRLLALEEVRDQVIARHEAFGQRGLRALGVAYRDMGDSIRVTRDDETAMTFLGFLILADPLKGGIVETLRAMGALGVSLKMLTGDHRVVAGHVAAQVGLSDAQLLTGTDLHRLSSEALLQRVNEAAVFAEVEPNQKEQIIGALRKRGHVVGYLGDGINDASALHAANVGISVDSAADVAREAADFVLLEKNLEVLLDGIREGRRTFANTLKYVFMATSANFGNMFSMAGVSLFLPFLPLLPKQILLTNLMTDFPEMTIATDGVDSEMVDHPRRWDIKAIRKFMITFGLVSSVFDYLTFGVLLSVLHATQDQFRTGWFFESVISASLIVLVIRSRKPSFKSRPGKYLLMATLLTIIVTVILPFSPLGEIFGFTRLSISFHLLLGVIVMFYIVTAEMAKTLFYQKVRF